MSDGAAAYTLDSQARLNRVPEAKTTAYLSQCHPHTIVPVNSCISLLFTFPFKDYTVALHRSDVGMYTIFNEIYFIPL